MSNAEILPPEASLRIPPVSPTTSPSSNLTKTNPSPRYTLFYYEDSSWHPHPENVNIVLSNALESRVIQTFYYFVGEVLYKGDYVNLVEKNEDTGTIRCIGYRDEESQKDHLPPQPFGSTEKNCYVEVKKLAKNSPVRPVLSLKLDLAGEEASEVIERFMKGVKAVGSHYAVTFVHKMRNSERKMKMFRETVKEVEQRRGSANEVWAWHGTSKEAIEPISLYGFAQMRKPKNGHYYGSGTYFAPVKKAYVSVGYTKPEGREGERHILLCRVILGAQEEVRSKAYDRSTPVSGYYDTGVDNLDDPRIYIVWTPYSNSHTLVEYVITFIDMHD